MELMEEGGLMSLFGGKEKKEIELLRSQMSPEQLQNVDLTKAIEEKTIVLNKLNSEIASANAKLSEIKQDIVETDEAVLLQSFGVYVPHYSYHLSEEYKEQLDLIRARQKQLIKADQAVNGNMNWQVNGSASKGKKMVKDMQKLLLRAFNSECDDAIEHVRFNNIEACEKKIYSSADAISKLGDMMHISITPTYIKMKIDELRLMHEYQLKKQEEKEAAKEARQRQREDAKVAKELEEARKALEKEQSHYENALAKVNFQLGNNPSEEERQALETKKAELLEQLGRIENEIETVDYRAANQKAGYVYIISNIGAFGENVYKIGMTRRLEPMERIDELGDASVPFNFDVHAMIFTDDAPKLEAALHNAFAERKLNYVNQRREFFNVTLDEIKTVVKNNFDKTVEFVDIAPAEQYRESIQMRKQGAANPNIQPQATSTLNYGMANAVANPVQTVVTCPNCGNTLSKGAHFCGKCGTKIS